jgi:hypothetical protein
MLDGDRAVGILALDKAEPDFYTPEHGQIALAFASIVARALVDADAGDQSSYA